MARVHRSCSPLNFHRNRKYAACWLVSLVAVVTMVFGVSSATGQTEGLIELSDSPDFSESCVGLDTPGLTTIYVLHDSPGATASRFRIQSEPGLTMTYVSEVHYFAQTIGNTQTGITICYGGACLASSQLLVAITYMRYGTSENCSELLLVPHPDAETVEAMNCNLDAVRTLVRNYSLTTNFSCGCPFVTYFPGEPTAFDCTPLPVEETTWGRIKAFYR
jgi:hypothetical protein